MASRAVSQPAVLGRKTILRQQADGVEAVTLQRYAADRDGHDLTAARRRGIDQDALVG